MTPEQLTALRDLIGTAAIERLSGLDRRDIARACDGRIAVYPDTAERLRVGLREALRAAGPRDD